MANKFYTSLKKAQDEVSEVQPLYRAEVEYALGHSGWHEYEEKDAQGNPRRKPLVKVDGLAHIGRTDGIIKASYLDTEQDYAHATYIDFYTLLECKLNQSFREDRVRAEVLLQVVCYLKQMQDNGDVLPKAVIIGSKVDCFAVGINALSKYAAMDITGYKSASTAYKYNTAIMQEMLKDEVLLEQCLIFDINADFDMQSIAERVVKLAKGINLRLSLDVRSVAKAFDYFTMYVLKNTSKMDIRKQQELFLKLLLDAKDNDYVLNNDRIYVAGERVDVDGRAFRTFQATYKVTEPYTSDEERAITATADRLIEDADRRRKGDFYTPTVWVDEAHKMLTEQLGADWREKYVVWDCAAGTKNLTRDYGFKELYSSTLIEGDLALSAKYNVAGTPRNENGCAFQYDFLNDDVDEFEDIAARCKIENRKPCLDDFKGTKLWNVARGLIESLCAGKSLLFFINPPYGTAKSGGCDSVSKAGIAVTKINAIMKQDKIGASAQQLYAQFLYRIGLLKSLFESKIEVGLFAPPAYITGSSFKGLRVYLMKNNIAPVDGFCLQACEFADCAEGWGISFILLNDTGDFENTCLDIKSINANTLGVDVLLKSKRVYNLDDKASLSSWIKVEGKGLDAPQMKSALSWGEMGRGKLLAQAFGYIMFNANNVEQSKQFVSVCSSCMAGANGVSITPENFKRVCGAFTARRLITGPYATWVNWQDEYMIPNTEHPDYARFEADSIVYSLFNAKSNQSSLRDIDYNGKKWNIKNEFFWLSSDTMLALARAASPMNKDVEQDVNLFTGERYVYTLLQQAEVQTNLSDTAKAVLAAATKLVIDSFKYRQDFAFIHPEYHINTWDAGWYQIKGILKEYMPDELKQFSELYKQFGDELRPLVYELGFLYK